MLLLSKRNKIFGTYLILFCSILLIAETGIKTDPDKMGIINKWETLKNVS